MNIKIEKFLYHDFCAMSTFDNKSNENLEIKKSDSNWDNIFGYNSPIKAKPESVDTKEWIDEWISKDKLLEEWINDKYSTCVRYFPLKKLKEYFTKKEHIDKYFKSIKKEKISNKSKLISFDEKYLHAHDSKIERINIDIALLDPNNKLYNTIEAWDNLEAKYDIPELALLLRRYDIPRAFGYLINGKNLDWIKKNWDSIMSVYGSYIGCQFKNGQDKIVYLIWEEFRDRTDQSLVDWLINEKKYYSDADKWFVAYIRVHKKFPKMWNSYKSNHEPISVKTQLEGQSIIKPIDGCAWWRSERTLNAIARHHHLNDDESPWNKKCCAYADQNSHFNILKWLNDS